MATRTSAFLWLIFLSLCLLSCGKDDDSEPATGETAKAGGKLADFVVEDDTDIDDEEAAWSEEDDTADAPGEPDTADAAEDVPEAPAESKTPKKPKKRRAVADETRVRPADRGELAQLRRTLASGKGSAVREAITDLLNAKREDAPRLHRWLHRQASVPPADYKNVLRSMGAAVPDSNGRFRTPARVADLDWLNGLVTMRPNKLGAGLRKARTEATLTVALIRAMARTGHPEASLSLVRFGYRHLGAFRDECGRQIRSMGVSAVPGLIRCRALKDPQAYKMVRYASYQLDRMNFTRPVMATKQADPRLLVELLHAYGEVRVSAAVKEVLKFTNDTDMTIRRAARWAMLRYVSGRPPRAKKRKLKLTGGRQSARARTVYWTYRQLATRALSTELAAIRTGLRTGERMEKVRQQMLVELEPRTMAERLFAHQERQRARARKKDFAVALNMANAGKIEEATSRLDGFLAQDPYLTQREKIAPFYFKLGKKRHEKGKLREAAVLLTKALHLAPKAKFAADARGRVLLIEVLLAPGPAQEQWWKLSRALELSPGLTQASDALDRLEGKRRQRVFIAGGVGGGSMLLLALVVSLISRRLWGR